MKRFALVLLAVMALVVVTSPASAQNIRWGLGAGLLMPMGDYGDADKMGYTAAFGGTYNLPSGLGIRVDASYGTTSEKDGVTAHSTKLMGGMASVVYAFGSAGPKPYVTGGLGLHNVKIDEVDVSETKVAFGLGAGVTFPLGTGGNRLFAETRYTSVSTSVKYNFLPIVVGISFGK
jgi:hypothetical protein